MKGAYLVTISTTFAVVIFSALLAYGAGSTAILKGNGSGGMTAATADVDYASAGATGAPVITMTNSATGTVTNGLVSVTGTPSTAVKTTQGAAGGVIGICRSGCGTSGTATIQLVGSIPCIFDGPTTSNHYVAISASADDNCTDSGASFPVSGQVIGRIFSTNGGPGTYTISLSPEVQGPFNAGNLSAGTVAAARMPALTGDTTSSAGSTATTTGKVNGVTYSASPATDTAPVITASNTATYTALSNCLDSGGNHLNYNTSTHAFSCGTTSSGAASPFIQSMAASTALSLYGGL